MNKEPALIIGALQAALALAVSFGLQLTAEQVGAIMTLAAAVFAIVTRYFVTPKLPAKASK